MWWGFYIRPAINDRPNNDPFPGIHIDCYIQLMTMKGSNMNSRGLQPVAINDCTNLFGGCFWHKIPDKKLSFYQKRITQWKNH